MKKTEQAYYLRKKAEQAEQAEQTAKVRRRILAYLRSATKEGPRFLKSRDIGQVLGMSPNLVGRHLAALAKDPEADFKICVWGGTTSAFVWAITPKERSA